MEVSGKEDSEVAKNNLVKGLVSTPNPTSFAQSDYRILEETAPVSVATLGDRFSSLAESAESGKKPWDRQAAIDSLADELDGRQAFAQAVARREGWSPIGRFSEDAGHELMAMLDGTPYEYVTDNANAAISSGARAADESTSSNLNGSRVSVGIWDQGSVRASHRELTGRVDVLDGSNPVSHATHAGGTIAAAGISPSARGMAPAATLLSHNWSSDLAEMAALAMSVPGEPDTIQISSHSYGFVSGWAPQYSPPRWYGNPGEPEGENFGLYDWYAAKWDELCYNAPYFLPFKSSGNNRIDDSPATGVEYKYYDSGWKTKPYDPATDPADDGSANGGYDTIPLIGNAKNVMTVGAVNDAVDDGQRSLNTADMTAFSGWGPTDDGRIKPDIVANGTSLYSTKNSNDESYGYMSGTSMATPSAAGSAALLVQLHGELFPGRNLHASTLKGLIIHTADDLGQTGPDYQFGWGLMNTRAAINQLEAHHADSTAGFIRRIAVAEDQSQSFTMSWDGHSPIRATLCWTDPAGQQKYALDDRTPRLVNDLDLRLIDANGATYHPFVLDPEAPSAPADTGDNIVDNVEQVRIDAPTSPGIYQVVVSSKGALRNGNQEASLVVSGLTSISEPPAVALDDPVEVAADGSGTVRVTGVINDADSAICDLQVECSSDGGISWHNAFIASAGSSLGPATVLPTATRQVVDLPADASFTVVWDSAAGDFPVSLSSDTKLRVRAWDGTQFSAWNETDLFQVDNLGPEIADAILLKEHRAFGRYVVNSSYAFSWSNIVDDASGVAGYRIGVNDDNVDHALFQTNETVTVQGLPIGQESTIFLWAVDGAGNISDPFSFLVYSLQTEGYWDGTGIPDAAFAQGQSISDSGPQHFNVQTDSANNIPVLRWPYKAGKEYAIEYLDNLQAGSPWTRVDSAQFSIDSGWVIWANRGAADTDGPTGFYRIISK